MFEGKRGPQPVADDEILKRLIDEEYTRSSFYGSRKMVAHLRHAPELRVIEWMDAQAMDALFLSAITVAELRAGVALLPAGKRRAGLQENLEKRVLPLFAGRVLPFDLACTHTYAALMAKARTAGLAIAAADRYIAAIAAANGFAVTTRGTSPFEAAGAAVINPWQA